MSKKVLIMEDDEGTSDMLSIIAEQLTLEVIVSDRVLTIDEIIQINPNLIISDHWINGKLGGVICKEIKENPKTKRIPVILVSAVKGLPQIAIECKVNAFLEKPFDIEDLMQLMRRFSMDVV